MSVYKEGYHAVEQISKNVKQVFNDACDAGAPVKKDSQLWHLIKQLKEWYGVEDSKKKENKNVFSFEFELMDEWAVSDERKTAEEALERYRLTYTKLVEYQKKPYLNLVFKGMHGFVYVEKIK